MSRLCRTAASLLLVVAAMATLPMMMVRGQIGVSTCSCVPREFTITFNFDGTCDEDDGSNTVNTMMDRPGTVDVQCIVMGEGSHVTDFKPVVVTAVDAMELTADLNKASQSSSRTKKEFVHGDTFEARSAVSKNEVTAFSESTVPAMIQLSIVGKNAAGEEIVNVFAIKLSTDCGAAGMLQEGDSVGWVVLSTVEKPLSDLCPAPFAALGGGPKPKSGPKNVGKKPADDADAAAPAADDAAAPASDGGDMAGPLSMATGELLEQQQQVDAQQPVGNDTAVVTADGTETNATAADHNMTDVSTDDHDDHEGHDDHDGHVHPVDDGATVTADDKTEDKSNSAAQRNSRTTSGTVAVAFTIVALTSWTSFFHRP